MTDLQTKKIITIGADVGGMISEDCDLDSFIEAIVDLTYHEVLTSILREGYESNDLLVHEKREGAAAEVVKRILVDNRALRSFIFLLQTGQRPDPASEKVREDCQKFHRVPASLL